MSIHLQVFDRSAQGRGAFDAGRITEFKVIGMPGDAHERVLLRAQADSVASYRVYVTLPRDVLRSDSTPMAFVLRDDQVARIVAIFEAAGAQAKVSSIHVNGWFGDYDKLSMTKRALEELFGLGAEEIRARALFVGDSPNDAPMFAYFPNAVGVANVRTFAGQMAAEPAYVTEAPGGLGFAELADALLEAR